MSSQPPPAYLGHQLMVMSLAIVLGWEGMIAYEVAALIILKGVSRVEPEARCRRLTTSFHQPLFFFFFSRCCRRRLFQTFQCWA